MLARPSSRLVAARAVTVSRPDRPRNGSIDRIRDRATFRSFRTARERGRSGALLVVRVARPGVDRPAVAYAISRSVGSAVVRNRLRRQLRVAAQALHTAGDLLPGAYLVIVRPEAAGASMTTLRGDLERALQRLAMSGA